MLTLTPTIAVRLAQEPYEARKIASGRGYTVKSDVLSDNFDFTGSGVIHAVSGSIISTLFNRTSGFVVVGKGKGRFTGDVALGIRGTKMLSGRDWFSNLNAGIGIADNQSRVHSGFQKVFNSMRPALERQLAPLLRNNSKGLVHCAGHSLGGGLAHLAAIWIKQHFGNRVALYTFGAPRVGLNDFALKSTGSIDKIYRCVHGDDPVPMVPVWPFFHAPLNGSSVLLTSATGINPFSHSMMTNPGYVTTARGQWEDLQRRGDTIKAVRLTYERRFECSFSNHWQEKLMHALITLLRDAGVLAGVSAQVFSSGIMTFYDHLAATVEKVVLMSPQLEAQVMGLLGHMLVFAGKLAVTVTELSARFIRWVFKVTLEAMYSTARRAVDMLN
ncbi:lipase family protein [Alkalimonas collagenimarina]|uniref:Lipase family protein n=1 Tax=Alkalimonas collagenimarina TaxID=400390 RepID=A0ABT9H1A4_9GAMM|nr:lipase family protein [Alkalimonas collagenimarina]MDP4536680.1 lipase family protein [Alkalimonas collagenimarina]